MKGPGPTWPNLARVGSWGHIPLNPFVSLHNSKPYLDVRQMCSNGSAGVEPSPHWAPTLKSVPHYIKLGPCGAPGLSQNSLRLPSAKLGLALLVNSVKGPGPHMVKP